MVMAPPGFDDNLCLRPGPEPFQVQALVPELAIEPKAGVANLSQAPFCQGLPGSIRAVSIPSSTIHFRMARDTNSGPLSDLR
jgi:hypothetical protein